MKRLRWPLAVVLIPAILGVAGLLVAHASPIAPGDLRWCQVRTCFRGGWFRGGSWPGRDYWTVRWSRLRAARSAAGSPPAQRVATIGTTVRWPL